MQSFDTTPEADVVASNELPCDAGTLEQQAKLKSAQSSDPKSNLTRLEAAKERIRACVGFRKLSKTRENFGREITNCLADVQSFSNLIDDRIVRFEQLSASFHPREGFRIQCFAPPSPERSHPADEENESQLLSMIPTQAFFQSVTRYANKKTHVQGLTGTFLKTMISEGTKTSREIAADLCNYLFKELELNHVRVDSETDELVPKSVLLRTLRRDIRPVAERRWPRRRSCRAILHDGFRDDISHLWLMKELADIIPTGTVVRYSFNGDLLRGSILIPDIVRVEKDSEYGGGVFFFSGEVGNRRCGAVPFLFRSISQSTVLVGKPWGVTHSTGGDPASLAQKLHDYIHRAVPLVTTSLDRMLAAREIVFSDDDAFAAERLLISLRTRYSQLSRQDLRLWRFGISSEINLIPGIDLSVLTLQNGLTRMSQSMDDVVRQIQLDTIAGNMLDLDWDKIVDRARTITDDQVREIFPSS